MTEHPLPTVPAGASASELGPESASQSASESASEPAPKPEAGPGPTAPSGAPTTGDDEVDAILAALADVDVQSPTEQVETFSTMHRQLAARLAALGG